MAPLDSGFNVVGIQIPTVENNEVFQSSGDEELPIFHETQIAGPEISSLLLSCNRPVEKFRRQIRLVPVALSHA